MSYLAALLPAIGHDPLDPRLAMRFTVVGIDYPDTETMQVTLYTLAPQTKASPSSVSHRSFTTLQNIAAPS